MSLAEILEKINRLEGKFREGRFEKSEETEFKPSPSTPPPVKESITRAANRPEMDEILSSWNSVINYIKTKKMSIASYLGEGYPANLDARTISIGFSEELKFHKEVLESPENRRLIEEAIKEALGLDLKAAFILVEPRKAENQIKKEDKESEPSPEDSAAKEGPAKIEVEPIIKSAQDIFGGTILRRPMERPG